MAWEIETTDEYAEWFRDLFMADVQSAKQIAAAVLALREEGPALGRPLVDRIKGSTLHNLKELRPGSVGTSELRVLSAFDPWRAAILLIAGDKSGDWRRWYKENVPVAEQLYASHVKDKAQQREGGGT
ncbi:MAG: type II toxin-antitoxin system RelE/ParE family toxin [Actinomadura sp.]